MHARGQWLNVLVGSLERKFKNKQTNEDGSHIKCSYKTKPGKKNNKTSHTKEHKKLFGRCGDSMMSICICLNSSRCIH